MGCPSAWQQHRLPKTRLPQRLSVSPSEIFGGSLVCRPSQYLADKMTKGTTKTGKQTTTTGRPPIIRIFVYDSSHP